MAKAAKVVKAEPDAEFPLLTQIDEWVEGLRKHVPAAFKQFDEDAIHDARVSTRKLKSAIDLLSPVLSSRGRRPFGRILRRLRRRLGPLRDLDVMIGHLEDLAKAPKHAAAATWLAGHLGRRREEARRGMSRKSQTTRMLSRLGAWWGLRGEVVEAREAVTSLLAESVHLQLDAFAEQADRIACVVEKSPDLSTPTPDRAVSSLAPPKTAEAATEATEHGPPTTADLSRIIVTPEDKEEAGDAHGQPDAPDAPDAKGGAANGPDQSKARDDGNVKTAVRGEAAPHRLDPHELRIAGKALRYTLDMAVVEGHRLPPAVAKTFKKMQEALGLWHDYVVLTEAILRAALETLLPHHDAVLASEVLDLARATLHRSARELQRFSALWLAQGEELARTIRAAFPLTRALQEAVVALPEGSVSALQTGPGPCDSGPAAGAGSAGVANSGEPSAA